MAKILHAALMLHPFPGIANQMRWEQKAAENLGIDWTVKIFCSNEIEHEQSDSLFVRAASSAPGPRLHQRVSGYIDLRRQYYQWLSEQSNKFDLLILRYSTSDPLQSLFIRNCPRPVYLVHHTLEVGELKAIGGRDQYLRILLERVFGAYSHRKCAAVIGVTNEIANQNKITHRSLQRVYCYSNGIDISDEPLGSIPAPNEDPSIAFVAGNFSPWHGLDLLLDSVSKSTSIFSLHLIGNVLPADARRASGDSRVVLHGQVDNPKLKELLSSVHVGLSSFALHRNGMREACPLKTREYLAAGIPVYSGHCDVFPTDCGYYAEGDPDIDRIIEFSKAANQKFRSRTEIRDTARIYIDKQVLLNKLYSWLHNRDQISISSSNASP